MAWVSVEAAAPGPDKKNPPAADRAIGVGMEDTVQKSCWGITARAVIGFAAILVLAYFFGGI